MERVLVTGSNSYIGTNVEKWLMREPEKYSVKTLDLKDPNWKDFDFSKFDVVFHVAGLVHVKTTKKNKKDFFTINRDLTCDVSKIAKEAGVRQFIFMSTMNIFGVNSGVIDENTVPKPRSYYGLSKFQAEQHLKSLISQTFSVCIVRPPIVYGPQCSGNYKTLSKLSKKVRFIPEINNSRSMIYIDNLSELIRNLIDKNLVGTFHPQNKDYVNVTALIKKIADYNNNHLYLIKKILNFVKYIKFGFFSKAFGTLVYSKKLSTYDFDYNVVNFIDSVKLSESCKC